MAKKKKIQMPPPVFATSSVKSRANVEDEKKRAEEAEEKKRAEEEAARIAAESPKDSDAASSAATAADSDNATGASGAGNAKGGADASSGANAKTAAAGKGEPAASGANDWESLVQAKEKEELGKLGGGGVPTGNAATQRRTKAWAYLRPAGSVSLPSDLEDEILAQVREADALVRKVTAAKAQLSAESSQREQSSTESAEKAGSATPSPGSSATQQFLAEPSSQAGLAASRVYMPDAYKVSGTSKLRNYERLSTAYADLQELGFGDADIQGALLATFGYDARAALEWLVLRIGSPSVNNKEKEIPEHLQERRAHATPPLFRSRREQELVDAAKRREATERYEAELAADADKRAMQAQQEANRQRNLQMRCAKAAGKEKIATGGGGGGGGSSGGGGGNAEGGASSSSKGGDDADRMKAWILQQATEDADTGPDDMELDAYLGGAPNAKKSFGRRRGPRGGGGGGRKNPAAQNGGAQHDYSSASSSKDPMEKLVQMTLALEHMHLQCKKIKEKKQKLAAARKDVQGVMEEQKHVTGQLRALQKDVETLEAVVLDGSEAKRKFEEMKNAEVERRRVVASGATVGAACGNAGADDEGVEEDDEGVEEEAEGPGKDPDGAAEGPEAEELPDLFGDDSKLQLPSDTMPAAKKFAERLPLKDGKDLRVAGSWTGFMPSQILDQWVVKNIHRSCATKKSYNKDFVGTVNLFGPPSALSSSSGGAGGVAAGGVADGAGNDDGVGTTEGGTSGGPHLIGKYTAPFRTQHKRDAVEMASTYALWCLQREAAALTSVEELLPPAYRSCYRGWTAEEDELRLAEWKRRVRPRVEFCLKLSGAGSAAGAPAAGGSSSSSAERANFSLAQSAPAASTATTAGAASSGAKEDADPSVAGSRKPKAEGREEAPKAPVVKKKQSPKKPENAGETAGDSEDWEVDSVGSSPRDSEETPVGSGNAELNVASQAKAVFNYGELTEEERRAALEADWAVAEKWRQGGLRRREKLLEQRQGLPVAEFREDILDIVNGTRVSIVSGSTGSGKTTQVPQYVLEEALLSMLKENSNDSSRLPNIIVTEPRRISAVSVGARVAQELGEKVGENLVGYQIRLEKKAHPKNCRLLFCTTGVLLQRMKQDPHLAGVTHVFVDEVHERSAESDLALLLLKRNLAANNLKVCLMSATADEGKLRAYFMRREMAGVGSGAAREAIAGSASGGPDDGDSGKPSDKLVVESPDKNGLGEDLEEDDYSSSKKYRIPPPRAITVPGRIFPVEEHYLEDVVENSGFCLAEHDTWDIGKTLDDSDDENANWIKERVEMPYDSDMYSKQTLETLYAMDHSRINYDLIECTLEYIEGVYTKHEAVQSRGDARKVNKASAGPVLTGEQSMEVPRHDGAVLIFLPGMGEISRLHSQLQNHEVFGDPNQTVLVSLHSVLSSQDQAAAFDRPPYGMRKIVLSTNIAETGVTIPDVVFVIDCGKVKQQRYHEPTNTSSLKEVFISRAEATQRRGRAGRVRNGVCFRLYTRKRFDRRFLGSPVPELLRCSLTELLLSVLIADLQPAIFQDALDAPPATRVQHAVTMLREVGCCVENANQKGTAGGPVLSYAITPLGRALARLPVDIRLGKMLLIQQFFGGSEYVLTAVAALSNAKSVFLEPFDDRAKQDARRRHVAHFAQKMITRGCASDHLSMASAVMEYEALLERLLKKDEGDYEGSSTTTATTAASRKQTAARYEREIDGLCRQNFLSKQALSQIVEIKSDLSERMRDEFLSLAGWLFNSGSSSTASSAGSSSAPAATAAPVPSSSAFKDRPSFAAAVIGAGLRPNIARFDFADSAGGSDSGKGSSSSKGAGKGAASGSGPAGDVASYRAPQFSAGNDTSMRLHGSSLVRMEDVPALLPQARWLAYYTKVRTQAIANMRDATVVSNPVWLLLFHTEEWDIVPWRKCVVFNSHRSTPAASAGSTRDWQAVFVNPRAAVALRQLKMKFQAVFRLWLEAHSAVNKRGARHERRKQVENNYGCSGEQPRETGAKVGASQQKDSTAFSEQVQALEADLRRQADTFVALMRKVIELRAGLGGPGSK